MSGCRLTGNINKKKCEYAVAGIVALYLANYHKPVVGAAPVADSIAYEFDEDGVVTGIHLPEGEKFYKVGFEDGTGSWTDDLAQGGNGAKYRTHTVNLVNVQYDSDILNQVDALSLGKFVGVAIDKAGRRVILGRTGGLSATSFNYASGAADADATGWTGALAGTSTEAAPLIKDDSVITPIQEDPVITP